METAGGTVTDPKAYKPGAGWGGTGAGHSWHMVSSKPRGWLSFPRKINRKASVSGVTKHGKEIRI